jgi:hypothetical protein
MHNVARQPRVFAFFLIFFVLPCLLNILKRLLQFNSIQFVFIKFNEIKKNNPHIKCSRPTGVTGNVLPSDIVDFVAHGVTTVLAKPVMLGAIREAIATYVVVGQQSKV